MAVIVGISMAISAADGPPLVIGPVLHRGPLEESFIAIEKDIPGFGGWYRESDGSVVVVLKDTAQAANAIARVSGILDAREVRGRRIKAQAQREARSISVRPALYSFSELAGFRHLLRGNLPKGVVSVDVDEVDNVLSFGVRDDEVAREVHAMAARLHIPNAAVAIELMPGAELRADLNDLNWPLRSGIAVTFSAGVCTAGINAIWNDDPNWVGFFTASHCGVRHTINGTVFYQGGYRIGYEADDVIPTSFYGCPTALCRYTDAAWVAFDYNNRAAANGYNTLALPTWSAFAAAGSTTIGQVVTISGEALPYPAEYGTQIFKVGRTTGWTYGQVTNTCEDVMGLVGTEYQGQTVTLLCQERSNVFSQSGDSGSGVFVWSGDGNTARFTGILWGGPTQYETWHSSSWNMGVEYPQYTYYY